jgi:hypothetical protein
MSRSARMRRVGGLAVSAVAAAPFVYLWVTMMRDADDPLTLRARLDMAIWIAVLGTPWMIAAQLLWRAWWRQAGARLSELDGPARLLAAAAATLPEDRRDWGTAMTAELTQVRDRGARWQFAAGCARATVFPPGGNRSVVVVTGALTVAALAATWLATGALLPPARVFALTFVGLLGGLATLTAARSPRLRRAGPGPAVAGLALAGVAGCLALTAWYVAEYPSTYRGYPRFASATLPPATAVALATVLAGGLWLALRPPRWLLPDRLARLGALLVIVAWLAEAPRWYRQLGGMLLDSDGGIGMGTNLGDAIWWTLPVLVLWALPLGVLGAAAGRRPIPTASGSTGSGRR